MAFPVVAAVNGGNHASDVGTPFEHTINLPSGIANGDLLVVFFTTDGSSESHSYPAGWTKLLAEYGTGYTGSIGCRVADGSEGSTILVTLTSAEQSCHTSYRITGQFSSATVADYIAASTIVTGTSAAPDAGALNPANWNVEDTLWITSCSLNGAGGSTPRITVYPTSYTDGRSDISAGGNGCVNGTARRENATSSEDAGAFTSDTVVAWGASTVGIRPAAASAVQLEWHPGTNQPYPDEIGVVAY
jgi:hypothetical protein